GATKSAPPLFHAVPNDTTIAMRAARRQRLNRTLEAIERVRSALHYHLERLVVFIATNLTLIDRHWGVLLDCSRCRIFAVVNARSAARHAKRMPVGKTWLVSVGATSARDCGTWP